MQKSEELTAAQQKVNELETELEASALALGEKDAAIAAMQSEAMMLASERASYRSELDQLAEAHAITLLEYSNLEKDHVELLEDFDALEQNLAMEAALDNSEISSELNPTDSASKIFKIFRLSISIAR